MGKPNRADLKLILCFPQIMIPFQSVSICCVVLLFEQTEPLLLFAQKGHLQGAERFVIPSAMLCMCSVTFSRVSPLSFQNLFWIATFVQPFFTYTRRNVTQHIENFFLIAYLMTLFLFRMRRKYKKALLVNEQRLSYGSNNL